MDHFEGCLAHEEILAPIGTALWYDRYGWRCDHDGYQQRQKLLQAFTLGPDRLTDASYHAGDLNSAQDSERKQGGTIKRLEATDLPESSAAVPMLPGGCCLPALLQRHRNTWRSFRSTLFYTS
jgi:hypothetical protein